VELALIKANSSCPSMMLWQELLFTTPDTRLLTDWQPCEQITQIRFQPASALAVLV